MSTARLPRVLWPLLILVFEAAPISAQEGGEFPPELRAAIDAGRASATRLAGSAATWTTIHHLPDTIEVVVECGRAPGSRAWVLRVRGMGPPRDVLDISERDGRWAVSEQGGIAGWYRPYEAPFLFKGAYDFLARSEPVFVQDAIALGRAIRIEESSEETLRLRLLALREQELVARATIQGWRDRLAEIEAPEKKARLAAAIAQAEDALAQGNELSVDRRTGVVIEQRSSDLHLRLEDWTWRDSIPPIPSKIKSVLFEEVSDPPTTEPGRLAMYALSRSWSPGQEADAPETVLVDLADGSYHRIPFRGGHALPGAFLPDRKRVLVLGVDAFDSTVGLDLVDLSTGEVRRLGGETLERGRCASPAISPDGKTVAVAWKPMGGGLEDSIFLVDLETGVARRLGEPRPHFALNWAPDGRSLVLGIRHYDRMEGPPREEIARLDLDGRLEVIRSGGWPVLVQGGRRILFKETQAGLWRTCDLDGGDARPVGDGLPQHGVPSASPDGSRVLMMKFGGPTPIPVVVDLETGRSMAVFESRGLWSLPTWR